jgi:hypothetical protein
MPEQHSGVKEDFPLAENLLRRRNKYIARYTLAYIAKSFGEW